MRLVNLVMVVFHAIKKERNSVLTSPHVLRGGPNTKTIMNLYIYTLSTHFKRNSTPEEVDWDILSFNIFYYEE